MSPLVNENVTCQGTYRRVNGTVHRIRAQGRRNAEAMATQTLTVMSVKASIAASTFIVRVFEVWSHKAREDTHDALS